MGSLRGRAYRGCRGSSDSWLALLARTGQGRSRLDYFKLSHYPLRWDVTYPDLQQDEWINSTYSTTQTFFPIVEVRQSRLQGQRQTYIAHADNADTGLPIVDLLKNCSGPVRGRSKCSFTHPEYLVSE